MTENSPLDLPFTGIPSFCRFPVLTDVATLDADVAVLGVDLTEVAPIYDPTDRRT
jgi:arginase family enzyme